MTVYHRHALEPWLHEAACTERVRAQLDASRPLVTWLIEQVGPSTVPRQRR